MFGTTGLASDIEEPSVREKKLLACLNVKSNVGYSLCKLTLNFFYINFFSAYVEYGDRDLTKMHFADQELKLQ